MHKYVLLVNLANLKKYNRMLTGLKLVFNHISFSF